MTFSYLVTAFIYGILHELHDLLWLITADMTTKSTTMTTTKTTTQKQMTTVANRNFHAKSDAFVRALLFAILTIIWSANISSAPLELTSLFHFSIFFNIF